MKSGVNERIEIRTLEGFNKYEKISKLELIEIQVASVEPLRGSREEISSYPQVSPAVIQV